MTKIFFALTLCLAFFATSAQIVSEELTVGPLTKYKDAPIEVFLWEDGTYFYGIGTHKRSAYYEPIKDYFFAKYRLSDFQLVSEKELEVPVCGKADPEYRTHIIDKKGIHIIFECRNRKDDMRYTTDLTLDKEGEILGEHTLLAVEFGAAGKNLISFSDDSTKLVIYTDILNTGEGLVPQITVYDQDFKKIWHTPLSLPINSGMTFSPDGTCVSNDGEVFILGHEKLGTEFKKDDHITDQYRLFKVLEKGGPLVYELNRFKKTFHGADIRTDRFGKLIFSGFYSDENQAAIEGNLYVSFDQKNLRPQETKFQVFNESLPSNFSFKSEDPLSKIRGFFRSERVGDYQYFDFRDFIEEKDSSLSLFVEHFYAQWDPLLKAHSYYAKGVFILNVAPDGSLNWFNVVQKKQPASGQVKFDSYYLYRVQDKTHLLYTEKAKNLDAFQQGLEPGGAGFMMADLALVCATISPNGDIEQRQLYRAEKLKQMRAIHRTSCLRIDENDLLFFMYYTYNKYSFARLRLED